MGRLGFPAFVRHVALAVLFRLDGKDCGVLGSRLDQRSGHRSVAAPGAPGSTQVDVDPHTKELLERADQALADADQRIKEVKDAGIFKAAERLHKARIQAQTQEQHELFGYMDLMLRAPEEDGEKKKKPGVTVQVSEKEMNEFFSKLSASCEKQFMAIVGGTAPAMHTFGDTGTNSSQAGCSKLNGAICQTAAQITRAQAGPAARTMNSTTEVRGAGCLPRECTGQEDLEVVASFMRSKAKEHVPGTDTTLQLSVDCTDSGGGVAEVGFQSEKVATRHGGETRRRRSHSGSTSAAASGVLLATLAAAQLG